jgi:hypothetical protein
MAMAMAMAMALAMALAMAPVHHIGTGALKLINSGQPRINVV